MRSLGQTITQQLALGAAAFGIVAGIIGHGNVAWNIQGIALGLWLAAGYVWARA
jgi:Na+/glutamate symporter